MQELLQEINARLSKIEKALGIRTPVTIDTSVSSVWILCDSATLEPIDPLTWTPHPWPAEPIAPGPGYPEPEEIDAGMAVIEDQETPESKTPVTVEVYSPERAAYVSKTYDLQPLTLNEARALVEEGEESVVCDVNNSGRYSYVSSIGIMRFKAGSTSWSIHGSRKFYRAVAGTSESKVATPTETRVAKKPVPRALDVTYGFKIRHHEPQVREVLVSEPGTRVTNGTKTGTIKAIGDRGIQVLWDGGLRAKWFDGTGFSVA